MSSITEQVASGAVLIVMMAVFVAVGISFVVFCDRLKDWLSGIPSSSESAPESCQRVALPHDREGPCDLEDRFFARAFQG